MVRPWSTPTRSRGRPWSNCGVKARLRRTGITGPTSCLECSERSTNASDRGVVCQSAKPARVIPPQACADDARRQHRQSATQQSGAHRPASRSGSTGRLVRGRRGCAATISTDCRVAFSATSVGREFAVRVLRAGNRAFRRGRSCVFAVRHRRSGACRGRVVAFRSRGDRARSRGCSCATSRVTSRDVQVYPRPRRARAWRRRSPDQSTSGRTEASPGRMPAITARSRSATNDRMNAPTARAPVAATAAR